MKKLNIEDQVVRSELIARLSMCNLKDPNYHVEVEDILEGLYRGELVTLLDIGNLIERVNRLHGEST